MHFKWCLICLCYVIGSQMNGGWPPWTTFICYSVKVCIWYVLKFQEASTIHFQAWLDCQRLYAVKHSSTFICHSVKVCIWYVLKFQEASTIHFQAWLDCQRLYAVKHSWPVRANQRNTLKKQELKDKLDIFCSICFADKENSCHITGNLPATNDFHLIFTVHDAASMNFHLVFTVHDSFFNFPHSEICQIH